MPFPYLGETKELNNSTRKELDGSFITLADGVTHYELRGHENGTPIVFVHGFSVPYFIFDPTYEFLSRAGFRVLRYDLFGRGFSDRPCISYDIQFFVRQLKNLLDTLEFKQVILIGLSMGGPITASFLIQYPQYVSKLVLIDPSGAKRVKLSGLLEAAKLPIIGELAFGIFGKGSLVRNIASDLYNPKLVEHFQSKYKIQMQYQGFIYAILSSMRNNMLESFHETYTQIGRLKKSTLLLWGKNDSTIPFENNRIILQAIPHAEFHAIDNCGHIPHYEQPEIVNQILLEFFSK